MRKLTLINAKGETLDLLEKKHFLAEASSFGFVKATEFMSVLSSFFTISEKYNQTQLDGTLYFAGKTPYEDYYNFVQFCSNQNLILEYSTIRTFRLPCRLQSIVKKENTKEYRKVTVQFIPLGLWYESKYATSGSDVEGGKIYDYTYDYTYSTGATNEVSIYSDSTIESPVKLTINGSAVNPIWRHYVNGVQVASGGCDCTIPENRKLVIDSTTNTNAMTIQNNLNQVISNEYQNGNFATERFLYLRNGNNRIVVSQEDTNLITISVEAQIRYESV